MSVEYDYYRVKPGSATLQTLMDFRNDLQHRKEMWRPIKGKFKADDLWGNERVIQGLVFKDPTKVPEGFRHKSGERADVYHPDMRTQRGREIWGEFQDAFIPGARDLADLLKAPSIHTHSVGHSFVVNWPTYEIYDQKVKKIVILKVPRTIKGEKGWTPPEDCVPMKTWQYWKIREP